MIPKKIGYMYLHTIIGKWILNFDQILIIELIQLYVNTYSIFCFCKDYSPTQVKCRLLISSIFDAMNSEKCWKFIASKMLEINSRHLT